MNMSNELRIALSTRLLGMEQDTSPQLWAIFWVGMFLRVLIRIDHYLVSENGCVFIYPPMLRQCSWVRALIVHHRTQLSDKPVKNLVGCSPGETPN